MINLAVADKEARRLEKILMMKLKYNYWQMLQQEIRLVLDE
jgi:hypothetical protein